MTRRFPAAAVLALLASALLVGCPLAPPSIAVSKTELRYPDDSTVQTFEVWSKTESRVEFSVTPKTPWITCTPPSGASAGPDDRVTITATIDRGKAAFNEGNIAIISNGGNVEIKVVAAPDYFTEYFDANDTDLRNLSILFTPADTPNYYEATVTSSVEAFPTDTSAGTDLTEFFFEGSDPIALPLLNGKSVNVYGTNYNTMYVGSDGYVAFGDDADVPRQDQTLPYHFHSVGISALFANLDLDAGGAVTARQFSDRIAVTYANVKEAGAAAGTSNSFQIELLFTGEIRLTYLDMDISRGIAGLSAGIDPGIPFVESNLSDYPAAR